MYPHEATCSSLLKIIFPTISETRSFDDGNWSSYRRQAEFNDCWAKGSSAGPSNLNVISLIQYDDEMLFIWHLLGPSIGSWRF